MKQHHWILITFIIIAVSGAIIYKEFRFYRTPVNVLTDNFDLITKTSTPQNNNKIPDLLKNDPQNHNETNLKQFEITPGIKHSIPLNKIVSGGPPKDGIPSIDKPKYVTVAEANLFLNDEGFGLAVEINDRWRFYPYQILVWHEIVNDTFENQPLLVTYCPLCFTGKVFERELDGQAVEFGISGKLYNSNFLMYDRKTDSLYSQALGEAVVGEKTNTKLVHYPSLVMTWNDFKKNHSEAEVLSLKTGIIRDYTRDPYSNYYSNDSTLLFPLSKIDNRLPNKTLIYGIRIGNIRKAYTESDIKKVEIINDVVGNEPIIVFWDDEQNTVRAYKSYFTKETKQNSFEFEIDNSLLFDKTRNTTVSFNGKVINSETGKTNAELVEEAEELECYNCYLEPIILENSFWFSWVATFPETELYENK